MQTTVYLFGKHSLVLWAWCCYLVPVYCHIIFTLVALFRSAVSAEWLSFCLRKLDTVEDSRFWQCLVKELYSKCVSPLIRSLELGRLYGKLSVILQRPLSAHLFPGVIGLTRLTLFIGSSNTFLGSQGLFSNGSGRLETREIHFP